MRLKAVLMSVVLTASFLSATATAVQKPKAKTNAAGQKLHEFFASEWDYTMQQNPVYASVLGDRRFNDKWEDSSLAAIQAQQQHTRQALQRLQQINRGQLSAPDQLSYDLFKNKVEVAIEDSSSRITSHPSTSAAGYRLWMSLPTSCASPL